MAGAVIGVLIVPVLIAATQSRDEPTAATSQRKAAVATATPAFALSETAPSAAERSSRAATPAVVEPRAEPESDRKTSTSTLAGCLERAEETFRLRDASGADAPKSRSWKSGFLFKRSSPVTVVASTGALKLRNYVGQRVNATGVLTNGEFRATSLLPVASCRLTEAAAPQGAPARFRWAQ